MNSQIQDSNCSLTHMSYGKNAVSSIKQSCS